MEWGDNITLFRPTYAIAAFPLCYHSISLNHRIWRDTAEESLGAVIRQNVSKLLGNPKSFGYARYPFAHIKYSPVYITQMKNSLSCCFPFSDSQACL